MFYFEINVPRAAFQEELNLVDKELHFTKGLTNRMRKDNYLVRTMNVAEVVDYCNGIKEDL